MNGRHSETSKATVYNTLNLFLEKKLIREVIVDPSKVFYDPNTAPHHHFYNVDTGELTDIEAEAIAISGLPAAAGGHGDRRRRHHRPHPFGRIMLRPVECAPFAGVAQLVEQLIRNQ